jgi:Domain of unknown function (DUF4282)/Protein of unknown function (DUF2510)
MEDTASPNRRGFFRSLYDFKFASLIGERFLRFVYAVLVVLLTIGAVAFALGALSRDNGGAIAILVIVVYFIYLIWLRIGMEFLIVFFQMGENVRAIRARGFGPAQLSEPAPPGAPSNLPAASPVPIASTPAVANTPAGWFDAPGDPTRYRYWDGTGWTEQYAPKGGSA